MNVWLWIPMWLKYKVKWKYSSTSTAKLQLTWVYLFAPHLLTRTRSSNIRNLMHFWVMPNIRMSIHITFPLSCFYSGAVRVCSSVSVTLAQWRNLSMVRIQWPPAHTSLEVSHLSLYGITTSNWGLAIHRSSQIQRVSLNTNNSIHDRPQSSSARRARSGRSRHHQHRQKPAADPPQNTMQQILNPGNLLRRLIPSSSLLNPATHFNWTDMLEDLYMWTKTV